MSLKELFQDTQKNESFSQEQVEQEVQSEDYLNEFVDKTNEFIPQVDFSKPENFAFFGSAEKYYSDAFDRIINLYPYDGSKSEKLKWRNESTLIDRWVYDNKYPKSTGYAVFSANGWGTLAASKASGYGSPATQEYIYVKGGPNTGSTTLTTLKDAFTTANIYDATNKQTSNLLFDLASDDGGITVEFWLNKAAFDNTKTEKEVIFDLWNGQASSSAGYGRFTLELTSSGNPFLVTAQSGTNGVFKASVGSSISSSYLLGGWHHYSFTIFNNSSQIGINFYTDGQLSQQILTGSSINEVTGTLTAYVGALRTAVSGTSTGTGWGKLSASLDEFRFWKTKRTSKDIGRYWWTNVDGGSNTDDYGIYLGIYYKFNEGIVGTTSKDQIVIDYSGRTTNGYWFGYGSNSRNTGSAFTAYTSASYVEVGDPILYSSHSEYTNQLTALTVTGSIHDSQNNSKLYTFFPSWVVDNDIQHGEELSKLTQIAASYFDTLYLQVKSLTEIKNNFSTIGRQEGVLDGTNELNQITGTLPTYDKPLPFAKALLDSSGLITPEILTDATLIETLLNRNENINYDDTISDIKNTIYFNLYSTLINAFKTKGTKRSYNNILHSFGIDEKLVKINTYPTNTTLYFDDNTNLISQKRKVVDFNNSDRYMGTVHQYYDASNTNSISFISGSIVNSSLTVECEALFPYKIFNDDKVSRAFFTESSIFGGHTAQSNTDLSWATNDYFNFVVKAHRPNLESTDAYFELSSSVFGSLTSSLYYDVYNNEKWNFAVKVYPTKYENIDLVSGADGTYTVEFYGVNAVSNAVQSSFVITNTISNTTGDNAVTSNKRLFVGAHYSNFTSSVLQYADTKVSYLRYWNTELNNDSLLQHAFDTYNYGTEKPANSAYLNTTGSYIPEIETLTLEWSFNQITGSDVNGQFIVQDLTSGSVTQRKGYPDWFNNISKYQYTGRGFEFPESSTQVIDTEYFATEKLKLPEVVNSSDMINILSEDDEAFTTDSRPELYITRFEKSMYQNISEEMINMFGTLVEFNNYIGRPIHKYRTEYKDLRYLRELFFSKVQNEPDLDRYLELYKWFDTSIGVFLAQLTPTTSQVTTKLENVIESHILERPKYQHKYLAINAKAQDPEDSASGINKHLYNWKVGHRPLTNSEQQNALYWKEKAERTGARAAIHSASLQVFDRKQSSPYRFVIENKPTIKGGVNFEPNKNLDFVKINTAPHGALDADEMIQPPANYLFVGVENTSSLLKVEDTLDPTKKRKYSFKVVSGKDYNPSSQGYGEVIDSTIALPANFISGTVVGGYHKQVAEQFISGVIITNIHNDTYGSSNEIPMQGPFTAQWVGGNQSRHIDLNTGNDSYLTRPEAWKILLGLGVSSSAGLQGSEQYQAALGWVGADYPFPEGNNFEPSYPVVAHKRATYLREEAAKRPVNIKNIQSTTTAASRLGNYRSNYEVIHTFGRTNNDRELIDAVNPGTETELSGILRTNTTTGRVDFTLPTRQVLKTVVGSRFSAPGGYRYSSRGYLNRYAEELSAYNAMSFRNREVIGSPHGLGSTPNVEVVSGALGTGSLLALALHSENGYVSGTTIPSFHKINKNPVYSVVENTEVLEADYDNGYFQHPIPQMDAGYSWIRKSLSNGAVSGNLAYIGANMGYTVPSGSAGGSTIQNYSFLASGEVGINLNEFGEFYNGVSSSEFTPVDFVGLNTTIRDELYGSEYPKTLGTTNIDNYLFEGINYNDHKIIGAVTDEVYSSNILNDLIDHRGTNYYYQSNLASLPKHSLSQQAGPSFGGTRNNNTSVFSPPSYFKPDGTGYYLLGVYNYSNSSFNYFNRHYIFQIDNLSNEPYDFDNSVVTTSASVNLAYSSQAVTSSVIKSFTFHPSGTYLYLFETENRTLVQLPVNTPWNINSIPFTASIVTGSILTEPIVSSIQSSSFSIATELTGVSNNVLKTYPSYAPYNNFNDISSSFYDMKWSPDGSKLFFGIQNKLLEYSASTPWEVSSLSYSGYLSSPFSSSITRVEYEFTRDGKSLFFTNNSSSFDVISGALGDVSKKIVKYTFNVARYDLSNSWTVFNQSSNYTLLSNVDIINGTYYSIFNKSGGFRDYFSRQLGNNYIVTRYFDQKNKYSYQSMMMLPSLDQPSSSNVDVIRNRLIYENDAHLLLNGILLNRNGPYGYPTFKQIRTGETKAVRDSKKNLYLTNTKEERTKLNQNIVTDVTSYYKEPVININKPVVSIIKDTQTNSLVFIKHTQDNNINYFSNKELNSDLGLPNKKDELQTADQVLSLLSDPTNTRYKLKKTVYTEEIYPKVENYSLINSRIRTTFEFPYHTNRNDRDTNLSSPIFKSDGEAKQYTNYDLDAINLQESVYLKDYVYGNDILNSQTSSVLNSGADLIHETAYLSYTDKSRIFFKPDGSYLYVLNSIGSITKNSASIQNTNNLLIIPLSTPWDITTLRKENINNVIFNGYGIEYSPAFTPDYGFYTASLGYTDFCFSSDGTKIFACNSFLNNTTLDLVSDSSSSISISTLFIPQNYDSSSIIHSYDVSPAWALGSSVTFTKSANQPKITGSFETGTPNKIFFKPDGTSFYVSYAQLSLLQKALETQDIDSPTISPYRQINQFNLTTPWILPTSFTGTNIDIYKSNVIFPNSDSGEIEFSFDEKGTNLFVFTLENEKTKTSLYSLSTAWDIRTCALVTSSVSDLKHYKNTFLRQNTNRERMLFANTEVYLTSSDSDSDWELQQGQLYLQKFTPIEAVKNPLLSQSIWPLDGALNYSTSSMGLNSVVGILQNNNTLVSSSTEGVISNSNKKYLFPSPLYAHKLTSYSYYSTISPTLPYYSKNNVFYSQSFATSFVQVDSTLSSSDISDRVLQNTQILYNNTPWTAASLRGKGPFNNSYEDAITLSKYKTQEYSILPEFTISDKVIEYDTKFNNSTTFFDKSYLSLTGSELSSSNDNEFYERYAYTNNVEGLLKYNRKINNKNLPNTKLKKSLKLTFEGLLKFIPYNGFYPVQRSLDITERFNESYKDGLSFFSVAASGSETPSSGSEMFSSSVVFDESKQFGLRSFITPLFAPGLLYNTIKAGIAVDYPILTSSLSSSEYYLVSGSAARNRSSKTALINNSQFDLRLPFETLVEPENYIKGINIIDQIPSSSVGNLNINITSSWNGEGDEYYKYMINNYLAEIPNFFLKEQKISAIKSVPVVGQGITITPNQVNREFRAIVKLKKTTFETPRFTSEIINSITDQGTKNNVTELSKVQYQYPRPQKFGQESITVYSNPSAFGPPCAAGYISASSGRSDDYTFNLFDSTNGYYSPYTPPYQDGESWLLLTYKPTTVGKFTLDDVIANTSASFLRYELDQYSGIPIQRGFYTVNGIQASSSGPMALYSSSAGVVDRLNANSMQLSASIFISVDNISAGERAGRSIDGGDQVSVADKRQLIISTKFETPILDFNYARMIRELSASHTQVMGAFEFHPSGAISSSTAIPKDLGMWHQYGLIPRDKAGIYMSIENVPNNYKRYGREIGLVLTASNAIPNKNAALTGSLIELIGGFENSSTKIGVLADTKEIKEAVVAIPFSVKNKKRQFFRINSQIVRNYKQNQTGSISNSLMQQFSAMKEYVFPPQFDFLNYNVSPVAMYVFEFTHTLSRRDLQDIWQNIMPEIGEHDKWKIEQKVIKHELNNNEIITPTQFDKSEEIRWLVFKVKKRAASSYYEMVGKNFVNKEEWIDTSIPKITYNWPYDFFTMIESGKLTAELEIESTD